MALLVDASVASSGFPILSIILLIVGVALIIAEFFIPGFGICGILGSICLVVDVFITAKTFTQGLYMIVGVLVFIGFLFWLFVHLSSRGKLPTKLVLNATMSSEQGFDSSNDYSTLQGLDGVALTVLRPVGEAEIRGKRYDVVTQGEFITKGTPIKVVEVEGYRIVVEKRII